MDHQIAIRSARGWLDASTELVIRSPDVFRQDEEIDAIVKRYLAMADAEPNSKLAMRIHAAFPPQQLAFTERQAIAAAYSIVGEIPKLVSAGEIPRALQINTVALSELRLADQERREMIRDARGINVQLLETKQDCLMSLSPR